MDIHAKYLGIDPAPINGIINDRRPFFMTDEEVNEMNYYLRVHHEDGVCWESNIIDQINENKYGWFDFSKSLIDIGAGAGEYPIFTNFAHSYAFEPNKRKQCLIYANMLSFDKIADIDVIPYAISDTPGIRKFNGWTEDYTKNSNKPEGIYDIEYRTLDSFNLTNVGLIKVDIEGFELFALRSGIGTLIRNNYPPLLIELWQDRGIELFFKGNDDDIAMYKNRRDVLIQLLQDFGYVLIKDPKLGDWETRFLIHESQLNGYENK